MDELLQQGITAYKAGKRDEARKFFITVVKQNPDNELAWGWMYNICNTDQERIHCLKQMLQINPKNEKAKQMLDSLAGNDFPFELSQKITSPTQEKYNTSPDIQTKSPVTSQENMHKNEIAEGVSQALEERDAQHRNNLIIFFVIMVVLTLTCVVMSAAR
jgi:tetratricopeptide (TPR) repeat protein